MSTTIYELPGILAGGEEPEQTFATPTPIVETQTPTTESQTGRGVEITVNLVEEYAVRRNRELKDAQAVGLIAQRGATAEAA